MNIIFRNLRQVIIDHRFDMRNIKSTGRDIGRNHDARMEILKRFNRTVALVLAKITMDRISTVILRAQFFRQAIRTRLCFHKDDDSAFTLFQLTKQDRIFLALADFDFFLLHKCCGRIRAAGRNTNGIGEIFSRQFQNIIRKRC